MADTYNSNVYMKQGGAEVVVGSGGDITVNSGGEVTLNDGAALTVKSGGGIVIQSGGSITVDEGGTFSVGANLVSLVGIAKIRKIACTGADTETDTEWDLPAKAVVLDVFIDVTTTDATETVSIGLLSSESGGDADGFAVGLSLATAGIKRGGVTVTTGSTEKYVASSTRGVLLANVNAGSDSAGDVGHYIETPFLSDSVTAKSVTHTSSSGTDTGKFDLYIVYIELE